MTAARTPSFFLFAVLALGAAILGAGCTQMDIRDEEETDPVKRLRNSISYSLWLAGSKSAPLIYFYGKGVGRMVFPQDGTVQAFKWRALPNSRSLLVRFNEGPQRDMTLAVGADHEELSYRGYLYRKDSHLRPLTILIQSGQITSNLLFDAVVLVVILVVGTNAIVLLNRLNKRLKRHIRVQGSDLGYYLRTEKPELVSVNHSGPIPFQIHGHILDARGIHCDIDSAEMREGGATPLFQLRSGTSLRFYKDAEAARQAPS